MAEVTIPLADAPASGLVIDADLRDAREAANAAIRDAEQAAQDNPDNV